MFGNAMPAEKLAALEPGDTVIVERSVTGWTRSELKTGRVAKLTPKQIVVHYPGTNGTVEARFRRTDGQRVGERGAILDPEHPSTVRDIAAHNRESRRRAIDGLAERWTRARDNLDLLRRLQVAISEYLDAES
jgi:hypothetical protein